MGPFRHTVVGSVEVCSGTFSFFCPKHTERRFNLHELERTGQLMKNKLGTNRYGHSRAPGIGSTKASTCFRYSEEARSVDIKLILSLLTYSLKFSKTETSHGIFCTSKGNVPKEESWNLCHLFVPGSFFIYQQVLTNSWRLRRCTVGFGHKTELFNNWYFFEVN